MQRLFGEKAKSLGDAPEAEDLSSSNEQSKDTAKANAHLLRERWKQTDDTIGHRLVNRILKMYKNSNIVIIALLKDDVDLFVKNHEANLSTLFLLEAACLCGAEHITNYILNNSDSDFDFSESYDSIAYALSARNKNLALTVAKYAKAHGQIIPGNIYLYNNCKYSDLKEIESIFNNSLNMKV